MIEEKFWDKKYREGGRSGRGSVGLYRNWKWNKIKAEIGISYSSLVDVGCGDLSFFDHPHGKKMFKQHIFKYLGIDISKEIIERNRLKYPQFEFEVLPAHIEKAGLRSQVVFALDLLFHLMKDGEFELALENLCRYASQFLVIYTWAKNPFEQQGIVTDGKSQYYRNLWEYMHIFSRNNMQMIKQFQVPYDPYGKLYIFRRMIY